MYNTFMVIGKVKNILESDIDVRLIIESKTLPGSDEKLLTIPISVSKEMYKNMKEYIKKEDVIGVRGLIDGAIINNKLEAVLVAEKITIAAENDNK